MSLLFTLSCLFNLLCQYDHCDCEQGPYNTELSYNY